MSTASTNAYPPAFKGLYGLVFDLIGTLTDSQSPVVEAFEAHAARHDSLKAKYGRDFWDRFAWEWDQKHSAYLKGLAERSVARSTKVMYKIL